MFDCKGSGRVHDMANTVTVSHDSFGSKTLTWSSGKNPSNLAGAGCIASIRIYLNILTSDIGYSKTMPIASLADITCGINFIGGWSDSLV
jgi:hypothetical protein